MNNNGKKQEMEMIRKKMKIVIIFICSFLISGFSPYQKAADTAWAETACTSATLDMATFSVGIPCVMVDASVLSMNLSFNASGNYWMLSSFPRPAACVADESVCAVLDQSSSLTIPAVSIGGKPYSVALSGNLTTTPPFMYFTFASLTPQFQDTPPVTDAGQTGGSTTGFGQEALSEIRNVVSQYVVTEKKLPGAVLAVAQGKTIIFNEAFGVSNIETGSPMTTDNLLHIASTNKSVTAFLMATLVDKGVLGWDTKATDIYPDFAVSDPQYSSLITITHLLSMTSGLTGQSAEGNSDFDTSSPARELFTEIKNNVPMLGAPGTQFDYSNYSISIAAYLGVLANAKAQNGAITDADLDNLSSGYADLLKKNVLDPIGMSHATLSMDTAKASGLMAASHVQDESGNYTIAETEDVAVDALAPAGGLKATSNDMIRFVMTVMNKGVTPEGNTAASEANIVKTTMPVPLTQGSAEATYGMGWENYVVEGLKMIGHSGNFDNFNSYIGFFPDKSTAFVVMVNADNASSAELTEEIVTKKIAELLNKTN